MKTFNFILNTIPLSNEFSITQQDNTYQVELSLNRDEINSILDNKLLPKGTKRFGNEIWFNGDKIKFIPKGYSFRVERERPNSSNVRFLRYYTNTNKLQVGFWSRAVYEYDNVTLSMWENIRSGNAICKTSGSNEFGTWWVGKTPSWGAAIHEFLVDKVPYRKL